MSKSIVDLVIDLENVNRKLDQIKNDPDYIDNEVKRIYGDKPRRDHSRELENIINNYL